MCLIVGPTLLIKSVHLFEKSAVFTIAFVTITDLTCDLILTLVSTRILIHPNSVGRRLQKLYLLTFTFSM